MQYYGIYKITNKVNGKMYIGQHITTDLDDGYLGSGVLISKTVKKYGKEAFTKEWLEFAENEEDLNYLERIYVDKEWLARPDTYNLAFGGNQGNFHSGMLGKHHTEETRAKMSLSKKGENNPMYGIESPFKGKTWSEEQKKLWRVPVAVYKDGVFLLEAPSVTSAAKITSCHPSKIVEVCRGNRKQTKGFVFKYTTKQGAFGRFKNELVEANT